ncbi:hypothetical protein PIB30_063475 [Stylosanthes scabra]|uniref:Uncharacterized protein n=1 Tax=Stylosanthes scabra TaxID=79078 RepID=A0ABU6WJM9_9FABA|nr:hypothetical protein [Stylosanthes scabra]
MVQMWPRSSSPRLGDGCPAATLATGSEFLNFRNRISLQRNTNQLCSSFILVELGLQRGLALVRILEIPILAFINFLPDVTARSGGEERAGAQSALTSGLTADHAVARVRCAFARLGQNPPEWLPRDRAIAR